MRLGVGVGMGVLAAADVATAAAAPLLSNVVGDDCVGSAVPAPTGTAVGVTASLCGSIMQAGSSNMSQAKSSSIAKVDALCIFIAIQS
jgi:hypothetical protein